MTNQTLVSTCATTGLRLQQRRLHGLGRHHRRHRRQADLRHFRQARRPRRPSGRQWPRRRVPAPGVRAQQGSAVHRAGHRCRRRHGRVRLVHRSLTGAPPGRRAVGRHPAKRGPRFGAHVVDSGASPHLHAGALPSGRGRKPAAGRGASPSGVEQRGQFEGQLRAGRHGPFEGDVRRGGVVVADLHQGEPGPVHVEA